MKTMTKEQIKEFPTSAEEYFHKQLKDGTPWKTEVYQFFEVINFYRKATNKLQEEINNLNGIIISQGNALEKEYALNSFLREENDKLKKGGTKMKVYVIKEWKWNEDGSHNSGHYINKGVVATIDEAESYVEGNRKSRDYDEYDLDISDLSYNQIFGERK